LDQREPNETDRAFGAEHFPVGTPQGRTQGKGKTAYEAIGEDTRTQTDNRETGAQVINHVDHQTRGRYPGQRRSARRHLQGPIPGVRDPRNRKFTTRGKECTAGRPALLSWGLCQARDASSTTKIGVERTSRRMRPEAAPALLTYGSNRRQGLAERGEMGRSRGRLRNAAEHRGMPPGWGDHYSAPPRRSYPPNDQGTRNRVGLIISSLGRAPSESSPEESVTASREEHWHPLQSR
jgi:hypothetical protein